MGINDRAVELAQKFDAKWGPFTRSLAEHPKTALAIGFGAGIAVGTAMGRFVLSLVWALVF